MEQLIKEGKKCGYCKKIGHPAKICRKRIAEAKGKFCAECNLRDSHNTSECYINKRASRPKPVRLHHVEEDTGENQSDDSEWASNVYENPDNDGEQL